VLDQLGALLDDAERAAQNERAQIWVRLTRDQCDSVPSAPPITAQMERQMMSTSSTDTSVKQGFLHSRSFSLAALTKARLASKDLWRFPV
jgi:hypothetical protein